MPKTPTPSAFPQKREKFGPNSACIADHVPNEPQVKTPSKKKERGYQHCIFCALIVCVVRVVATSRLPPSESLLPSLVTPTSSLPRPSNGHTQITATQNPTPPRPAQRLIIMLHLIITAPSHPITLWYHTQPTGPVYLFPSHPVSHRLSQIGRKYRRRHPRVDPSARRR
jgi:hypothetical protein